MLPFLNLNLLNPGSYFKLKFISELMTDEILISSKECYINQMRPGNYIPVEY